MTDESSDNPGDQAAGSDQQRRVQIHKLYLKDTSFESPAAPGIFSAGSDFQPQVELQLNTESQSVGEGLYEVVLIVTVTGKDDERTVFLVEIKQAGLFDIAGFANADHNQLLGAQCPNILFPFAREAIAELVQRGALPQLVLQPINFDAVYAQQLEQRRAHTRDTVSGGAEA